MILPNFSLEQYGMAGTQTVDTTLRPVVFDTTVKSGNLFSLNNSTGILTALKDCKIKVSYNIFMTLDTGDGSRNTVKASVRVNNVEIDYSQSAAYSRGYNYNPHANCSIPPTYIELSLNDTLDIVVIRDDDIQTPVVGSGQTWVIIEELLN